MSLYERNQAALAAKALEDQEKPEKVRLPSNSHEKLKFWFDKVAESVDQGQGHLWEQFFKGINAESDVARNNFCHQLMSAELPRIEKRHDGPLYHVDAPIEPVDLPVKEVITIIRANKEDFYHRFPAKHEKLKNCSLYFEVIRRYTSSILGIFPLDTRDFGYKLVLDTNDPIPDSCVIL